MLASFFSQEEEKKKKKKTIGRKKKCKERKELTFKLLLCPFIFGFHFWLHASAFSFQALFPWASFSSQVEEKKNNTKIKKQ
jgi:hypothetical protein